jgi:tetratricopeptide (TPR) repeat protein
VRAVLEWSRKSEERAERGLRLAVAVGRFWILCGQYQEGRDYLKSALANSNGATAELRANALSRLGQLTVNLGSGLSDRAQAETMYREAEAVCRETLALYEGIGVKWGVAHTLRSLAEVALLQGNLAAAHTFAEQSMTLYDSWGEALGVAWALIQLGKIDLANDRVAARALWQRSLEIFRELGHDMGAAESLMFLAGAALEEGDRAEARALFEESMDLRRRSGHEWGIAYTLCHLADRLQDPQQIVRLFGTAASILGSIHVAAASMERLLYERAQERTRTRLSEEDFATAWEEGQSMIAEEAIAHVFPNR